MLAKLPKTEDPLPVADAVALIKSMPPTKFDQAFEIHMRLGIDPKQADQIVRGSIVLPHGIGKSKRVVVFAKGNMADEARAAGAEEVGSDDLAKKIKEGWTDFDVCIAAPDMMGLVGPLGKVLGPRGLMPSPRAGTVTADILVSILVSILITILAAILVTILATFFFVVDSGFAAIVQFLLGLLA